MTKLILIPESAGYSAIQGDQVIRTVLAGGFSRTRLDSLGAPSRVQVRWILNEEQYSYIMSFWRGGTFYGSLPFEIDLVIDNSALAEYSAKFIPGTFGLVSQSGLGYTVEAELEVKPLESIDVEYDEGLVMVIAEYGNDASFVLDELETLMNGNLWP